MASSISRLISSVGAATRRVLRGQDGTAATLQTMLSRLLILGINVVTGIITARTLGPVGRGEQAAMILWSGFLASTMTLGLPSSLVYNLKRYPEEKSQLLCAALFLSSGLGLAASVIGIVFMPQWLAQYSAEVIYFAQWFMLNTPLALISLVSLAALEAIGDFTTANQVRFLITLSTLVVLIGFALTRTLTPFTSSLAYTFSYLPIFIWMLIHLWQLFRPHCSGLVTFCRRLVSYGLRSYGIDLLGSLALQVDQVLVVGLLSPSAMGIYVVALSLSRMLNLFQTSIVTVLFPKAAARPIKEVVFITGLAARVSIAVTLLAAILVMILGPLLLRLLYGSEYVGAVAVFRVLIVEVVLAGTTFVLAQAFMALGRPGIVTILQGVGLGLSVPLMLLLIPAYGLMGAGFALLASTTARLIFILGCYPLMLKVRPPNLLLMREDLRFLRQMTLKKS